MQQTDSELIQHTLTGDDDAFSLLVTKYQKQVHTLAWRIIKDFHTAEEITQDAFLTAYMELKTLKEPQRFAGWLSVITRRQCYAWLRKKRTWTHSLDHLEQTDNERLEETVYSEYIVEEKERTAIETQREVVKKLLTKLEESERTVVTLHYFGEMSCSEIGEFLGVSTNTIKSRLRRAQHRLKKNEPLIKEALENFKITPNLTENIMHKISQTTPAAPSGSKPHVPWLIATSSVVVVLIMLGFGSSKYLTAFQKPYSFDANSEIKVDIVDAPLMKNPTLKFDKQRQAKSANVHNKEIVSEKQSNNPLVDDSHAKGTVEKFPQWNLPKEAKARLGKGGTWSIQFSPDGTQLALSCPTGVWFYDVKTGKELSLLPGRRGSLAFSPDGRFLAKSRDGFQLWELATQREVVLKDVFPNADVLRFSNDSRTLVYLAELADTIYRVNIETGESTVTKMERKPRHIHVKDCALTEDKIVFGSRDGKIELWDTTTGQKISTLKGFGEKVYVQRYFTDQNRPVTMAFSPDGTRLATGNLDTSVQIWDTTTGEELITLQNPIEKKPRSRVLQDGRIVVNNPRMDDKLGRPSALAFSQNGTLLACGSEDATVKVWNSVSGELIVTFIGHIGSVDMLAFSPDDNTIASGSTDGTVRFWDINMRKGLQTRIAGHMWIKTASFLSDGSKLSCVSSNGIITVWDLKNAQKTTFKTKATLEEPLYWEIYRPLVLTPDGTKLASLGIQNYDDDVLRFTDVNTGREVATFPRVHGEVFSADGKMLASSNGNKISLLNTETGETREIITSGQDEDSDEHMPIIVSLLFSLDGKKIVSGTDGGLVQMWDVETGTELSSFFKETPPMGSTDQEFIRNLAFSSDGSLLAVGSTKRIRLIGSTKQPHFKEVVFANTEYNDTFIFSPDDTILIVAIGDGKIELWDVATGDILISLDGHSVSLDDLKFSPDNKTLMSVGGGNILLWDWDKVLNSARQENQKPEIDVDVSIEEQTTENVLQFIEHSSNPAKSLDRNLTQVEVYLANEWYEAALEQLKALLHPIDYPDDWNVTSSQSFQREMFKKISKAGKDVQDTEGFISMVNQLIDVSPDSMSIQLKAHLVFVKFFHDNGMLEKSEEQLQKIDSITANLPIESLNLQLETNLSLAEYYREIGVVEKADAHIQKVRDMITEFSVDNHRGLRLQLDTHFGLAVYYRVGGMIEKADEHIQKTGCVTENAWMVLGPFDNTDGIGYYTAYIPEDITEIDLKAKYDGLNGMISWKKLTDEKLDGYIHLGETNVDWHVSYTFATVASPDEREVQFRFDSDDQGKIWLNGKEVFTHTKTFAARLDTYTIPVRLKQGQNSILVKVCNEQGGWAFYLRITDQDGQTFDDLTINRVR